MDKNVVIVGGGFGGLLAARALRRVPVRVTLIDRENHHLFQPLLYQVATAGLSPGEIATPIRSVLRRHPNARVLMGEVVDVDTAGRAVVLEDGTRVGYDWLVLAAGTRTHYFGHDEWAEHARGLKSIEDALTIRERILLAFEAAEREEDPARRAMLLTFVVIGAGPTGVEMAGAISELSRHTLLRDFRAIDPKQIRVLLVEMADRLLPPFDPRLSAAARTQLEELGVEIRTSTRVTDVDGTGVQLGDAHVASATVIWASGVRPSELGEKLGVPLARGLVPVSPDCSLPDHPEVFVIGDMAYLVPNAGDGAGAPLPGLAPVAMQQGRHAARQIRRDLDGKPREPFRYRDKGMMATIGRSRAVTQTKRMKLTGLVAWLAWLVVHIWYLIGFRNRLLVMFDWFWSYVTFKRGARLIAHPHPPVHALAAATTRAASADPGSPARAEPESRTDAPRG